MQKVCCNLLAMAGLTREAECELCNEVPLLCTRTKPIKGCDKGGLLALCSLLAWPDGQAMASGCPSVADVKVGAGIIVRHVVILGALWHRPVVCNVVLHAQAAGQGPVKAGALLDHQNRHTGTQPRQDI